MPRNRRPTILTPEDAQFPLCKGIELLEETQGALWQTMKTPTDLILYQNLEEILEKLKRAKQCLAGYIKSNSKGETNESR